MDVFEQPGHDYSISEVLDKGTTQHLLRGVRRRDGRAVIIGTLRSDVPTARDVERLRRDYEVARRFDSPFVLRPLELLRGGMVPAVVFEDFAGVPLSALLGAPMAPGRFLDLAIGIVAAVAGIHRLGLAHRDLTPSHLLVDPALCETRVCGFGLAAELPRVPAPAGVASGAIAGTLPYMAPEQTGRINRTADHRADLYALGVIFYQMLTGALPFRAGDPLEWVHCHIAREPPPPADIAPGLPEMLDRIVLKLLSKPPGHRYQSAHGLGADLETCRACWRESGRIAPFAPGTADLSERLEVPHGLYGRAADLAVLCAAFERSAASGRPELILVSGASGIGKSALAHALRLPVLEASGRFLAGKFDADTRTAPYSTIADAFQTPIADILAGSEERTSVWQGRLREALGAHGRIVTDLVPALELVIGAQPPVPALPPGEADHRAVTVLRRFVGAFARPGRPLVLFLDDLQWADEASLALLQALLRPAGPCPLLVVGTCRDNEVGPCHPLAQAVAALRHHSVPVGEIALAPLGRAEVEAFLADALLCDGAAAAPLAALVQAKTGGNPFFVIQFLSELVEGGLVAFDAAARAWRWDVARIEAKGFTDNVAELMAGRLLRLPPATRTVLVRAACLGHSGDLRLLARVGEADGADVPAQLAPAVAEGMVVREGDHYRFVHDRVREAAFALLGRAEREALHLRIGRLMLAHLPPTDVYRKIFEVVDQFNHCPALLTDATERVRLAELNLLAGRKAKAAAAHDQALAYLAAGVALAGADGWSARYRLTHDLHLEQAQCEYLRGNLEAADALLDALLGRGGPALDRAACHRLRIALHTTRGEMDRAIACGLDSLALFGLRLPAHPGREQVEEAFAAVWRSLDGRTVESLIDLPVMEDAEKRMVMDLLSDLGTPAIFGRRNLLAVTVARMVVLTLDHGTADASVWAYVWFGAILVQRDFGRTLDGYRFGKLAYDLMERNALHGVRARVSLMFGDNINFYVHHVATDRDYILAAFRAATEAGDLPWACYSCNHIVTNMLSVGDPLDAVWQESERRLDFVRKAGDPNIADIIVSQQRFVQAMRGRTAGNTLFGGPGFDQAAFEAHIETSQMPLMVCWYHILKLQAAVIFGLLDEAEAAAGRAGALIAASGPDIQGLDYDFFAALALTARLPAQPPERQRSELAALERHLELLRGWSDGCPANFLNRLRLVEAEAARIAGRELEAERLYEQAIRSARDHGFVHHEALASERAAAFHRERGFELIADAYLRQAHQGYGRWGAAAKTRQIEERWPHLWQPAPGPVAAARFAADAGQLDLLSVVKAAQSISGELDLPKLQEALLRIALEQAGAQRGLLLLCDGGELAVQARAETAAGAIRVTVGPVPVATAELLPLSMLNQVRRSRSAVAVDGAGAGGPHDADPYVTEHRPLSMLCLPILREGRLVGALYLENAVLATRVTPDRLAALELLAAQAAITLEAATAFAERRHAEAALRDQLHFVERLIETIPAPVLYKDDRGRYVGCNQAFERVAGIPRERLIGKTVHEIWPRDLADVYARADAALYAHPGTQIYETSMIYAGGARHDIVFHKAALVRADGAVSGLVSVIWDVTERKQAALALARAKEAAEAANVTKSRFLAAASHDMRQPFQAIQLYHDLLMRRLQEPRLVDLCTRLGEAITAGSDLLDALFAASVLDSGTIQPEMQSFALMPLLKRQATEVAEQAAVRGLALRLVPTREIVRSDPVLLGRMLRNLLNNAIRYTARGTVLVGCRRRGADVAIEVWDTGIGIPAEKLEVVFEDFFQIGNPERHRSKGFGLGLSIVRRTARLLGHRVTVRSWPGDGSVFAVVVPRAG